MAYYILETAKMLEKVFAYVMEIAFVMSFVFVLIMAVRFLVRKSPKSLSYGLWGIAGIGFLYAALPFLQQPLGKRLGSAASAIGSSGIFTQLSDFGSLSINAGAGGQSLADAAAGPPAAEALERASAAVSAVTEALRNIFDTVKEIAIAAGAGAEFIPPAGAVTGGQAAQSAENGIGVLLSEEISLWTLLSVLWAAGMIIFAAYSIFAAVRLSRRVRFAVRLQDTRQLDGIADKYRLRGFFRVFLRDSKPAHETAPKGLPEDGMDDVTGAVPKRYFYGISHKYRIYECEQIDTPFVAGVFRPGIYLPAGLQEYERGLILSHEICHIRRKDHLVLLAAQILASIFWFHPLFWAAYIMMRRDMEMSCDEKAVSGYDRSQIADYSTVLLSFRVQRSPILTMTFGSVQSVLKLRISNLLSEKKRRPLLSAAAVTVSLCSAVILITTGCGAIRDDTSFTEWFQPIMMRDMEDTEADAILREMGTVIGQSQTVDGVTVTLDAAVRDEKNIILSFSVETEEEIHAYGGIGNSAESWMHEELTLEEWKERGGLDMTEEEFQQMYRSLEENPDYSKKLQFFGTAPEDTGYRILLAGQMPSEGRKLKVHLENIIFPDISLKGPFDFSFTAEKRAQSTVYTGDIPMKTESGEGYRVKRVSISPLMAGEIEIITDRDLSEGESASAAWNDELVFDGMRTDEGVEFRSVSTGRTIAGHNVTLRRERCFTNNVSVIRNDVITRASADQVFIDPTKIKAVNIGGVWLELDRMEQSNNEDGL